MGLKDSTKNNGFKRQKSTLNLVQRNFFYDNGFKGQYKEQTGFKYNRLQWV